MLINSFLVVADITQGEGSQTLVVLDLSSISHDCMGVVQCRYGQCIQYGLSCSLVTSRTFRAVHKKLYLSVAWGVLSGMNGILLCLQHSEEL